MSNRTFYLMVLGISLVMLTSMVSNTSYDKAFKLQVFKDSKYTVKDLITDVHEVVKECEETYNTKCNFTITAKPN